MIDIVEIIIVAFTIIAAMLVVFSKFWRKIICGTLLFAVIFIGAFSIRNAIAENIQPDYEGDGKAYFIQIVYEDEKNIEYQMLFIGDDGETWIYYDSVLKTGHCHFVVFYEQEIIDVIFYEDLEVWPTGHAFFIFFRKEGYHDTVFHHLYNSCISVWCRSNHLRL